MHATATALVWALTWLDGSAAEAKTQQVSLHPIEQAIIDRTNDERRRRGLEELELDVELLKTAREHAAWMTRTRTLRHTRRSVAENIAMGQRSSAEALRSWMNSSGHRANILSRRHRRIGVAAYVTPSGTIYWCQQFAD